LEKIIIVTGTPGVGKTVLSNILARKTGSVYLNLGEHVKQEKLYSRFDRSSKSYVIDERRLRKSLLEFFKTHSRMSIVVETHWLGRFMPKRHGMVAIVVRLDPVILANRLRGRRWPKRKVWENVESELIDLSIYEALKLLGARRVYQVDATRKRPSELFREALKLLSSRNGWNGLSPNWLERYDPIELSRKIL
jgi:adenylate kinase